MISCDRSSRLRSCLCFALRPQGRGGVRLAAALAGLLLAGALAAQAPDVTEEPALRAVIYQRLPSLDPHRVTGFTPFAVLRHVYEGLVGTDADNRPTAELAERWEKLSPTRWRFHLRSGVVFHDGRPLKTDDVVFSLQRARAPASEFQNRLGSVAAVSSPEPGVVDIETHGRAPLFLAHLTSVMIVPAASPDVIEAPVGTGPYRWVGATGSAEQPWDRIELQAFDRHWAGGAVPPRVVFIVEPDNERRVRLLLDGKADWIGAPQAASHAAIESHPDLWLESRQSIKIVALEPRVDRGLFADPRVREALDLAVDRQAVGRDVFGLLAKPASQLTTASAVGYVPHLQPVERDVEAARRLLAQAEIPPGTPVELHAPEAQEELAQELKRQLAEVGLAIQIRLHPNRDYYLNVRRSRPELFVSIFTNSVQDAGWLFGVKLRTPADLGRGESNRTGFSDPQIDAWVDRAAELEVRSPERLDLLQRIAERARDLRPIVPLVWTMNAYGVRRSLDWNPRADGKFFAWEVGVGEAVVHEEAAVDPFTGGL